MLNIKTVQNLSENILEDIWGKAQLVELFLEIDKLTLFLANTEIDKVLLNIRLDEKEKKSQLKNLLAEYNSENSFILNLIDNILDGNIIELLSTENIQILKEELTSAAKKIKTVKITFALNLKEKDLILVKSKLEKKYNSKIFLDVKIKPNLVGGFILEKDSVIIDASLEKALEIYRQDWVNDLSKYRE